MFQVVVINPMLPVLQNTEIRVDMGILTIVGRPTGQQVAVVAPALSDLALHQVAGPVETVE